MVVASGSEHSEQQQSPNRAAHPFEFNVMDGTVLFLISLHALSVAANPTLHLLDSK